MASGTSYLAVLTLTGNTTLGDATTTDTITLNARFTTDLEPTVNNSEDVGGFGNAWNDEFVSGTSYLATLTLTGSTTLGDTTTSDILYINSRIASSLIPTVHNTITLGTIGTNAYGDINSSGTLFSQAAKIPNYISTSGTVYSASTTVFNSTGSSTVFIFTDLGVTSKGPQIIFRDATGTNCTAIFTSNGLLLTTAASCTP